jgi:hypothetical protein
VLCYHKGAPAQERDVSITLPTTQCLPYLFAWCLDRNASTTLFINTCMLSWVCRLCSEANGTKLCGPDPFAMIATSFSACPPAAPTPQPSPVSAASQLLANGTAGPVPSPSSPPTQSKLPVVIGVSAAAVALLATLFGGGFVWYRHGCSGLLPPALPVVAPKETVSTCLSMACS